MHFANDNEQFTKLIERATQRFRDRFPNSPKFFSIAPGRVNLIGEHTDYNGGFALPMAIDRYAVIVATRRETSSDQSTFVFDDLPEHAPFTIDLAQPIARTDHKAANHLLGVGQQFQRRGHTLPNVDLLLTSDIPIGAGLASSAAIEVAMAVLLNHLTEAGFAPLELAHLAQRAEHEFIGTPVGILDMFTATHAEPGCAMLLDCQSETAEHIPLPDDHVFIVADTGIQHDLADGAYSDRQQTCASAAQALGVRSLREATLEMLEDTALSETQHRRARHVIAENTRTRLAAQCLARHELDRFADLMYDSHKSLRDDYEVSCPELDTIVATAGELRTDDCIIGARLTGAGFGGSAIVMCPASLSAYIRECLISVYENTYQRPLTCRPVRPGHSAYVVSI